MWYSEYGYLMLIFSELIFYFKIPEHFNYVFIFQQFKFRFYL